MTQFYAHTLEGHGPDDWEPLEEHLTAVADLAAEYAQEFGCQAWGKSIGYWHDLGKCSDAFQSMLFVANGFETHLEGQPGKPDHSTAGAKHAVDRFRETSPIAARVLAYTIAGHHAGLADWNTESNSSLKRRLAHEKPETLSALERAPSDWRERSPPLMPQLQVGKSSQEAAFQSSLFIRMLFSCLVDADFLATERFINPRWATERDSDTASVSQLCAALKRHMNRLQSSADQSHVNRKRAEVLQACHDAAGHDPGFFSLTVPTGGGKTLASLSFALDHAVRHELRRVIYAIPFTSIIEQNADVFRDALGPLAKTAVLEHHSNLDPKKESAWNRLGAENWDAPVIVTTNVQLFDSLFARRTSRCRKLHRIARSVIVLDEAQALPVDYLKPCLWVLRELVRNYGCTIVLCTATQPAIHRNSNFHIGLDNVREIVKQSEQLYTQMKRVTVDCLGPLADDQLISRLGEQRQVLCIVNTKAHAAELYRGLPDDGSAFHLSALMCPQHRAEKLDEIKKRIDPAVNQPCRVVSTQVVEAGVDIDFPAVYRALAGLDSIAQAAGRCNREGRREIGHVFVFETEQLPPPGHLRQTAETAAELIGLFDDLLGLDAVRRYFELHYWKRQEAWDRHSILDCFRSSALGEPICDFQRAAKAFHLISDETRPIIVPWGEVGETLVNRLRALARIGQYPDRRSRRALQRYTVQVRPWHWERLNHADCIETVLDEFPILNDSTRYHRETGLSLDDDPVIDPDLLNV